MLGVLPFIASLLVMILLVIAWPDIVLWLPRLAGGF
jgi:TRAP-type mannitol/chloroaromatic compound transport system permease large subunit